jgi:chorismate mutase
MTTLNECRTKIDALDKQIASLICQRVEVVKVVGQIKHQLKLPCVDQARETQILSWAAGLSKKNGLAPSHLPTIFKSIILICRKIQS